MKEEEMTQDKKKIENKKLDKEIEELQDKFAKM